MVDKQIIDDVDVSGCEHLTEIQGCWLSTCDYLKYKGNITNELCKYNPNCYYKQLKRKEQECEKLRFPMSDTNYAILTKEEFEQLDQLKAENEELKNEIEACYNQVEDFDIIATSKSNKLKQAEQKLEQIRQVCTETKSVENIKDMYTAKLSGLYLKSRQILQIIDRGNDENL